MRTRDPAKTETRFVRTERFETIVIGAGQAGLAVGQQLARRDADFVILDAEERVGDTWRRRWSSLRLFTPAEYSGLPDMPFPAPPSHLPDKDEVADYLERYADRFDLPVRSSTRVTRMWRDSDRFVIATDRKQYEADNVVVATGPFHRPRIPAFAAQLSSTIPQIHSSQYRDPLSLAVDGPALVVGAGNSGAQIALELARFRPVMLAGRDTGHLPRRILGRDVFHWIWPVLRYATADTPLGKRLRSGQSRGDSLIGIPESAITSAGVQRIGRITGARDGRPVADGRVIEASVIVWSTGFTPAYDWIDLPVFEANGSPRHRRGVVEEAAGLFFAGLRFQHRMTSSLLGGVGDDATFIATCVARRAAPVGTV
jgi:putative flavoprotein involved in K+ transport